MNNKVSDYAVKSAVLNFQYDVLEFFISCHANIPSSMINFARDQNDPRLIKIIFRRTTENVEHVNLDKKQIDFSPLTVVQNGFDTMVKAKNGSIVTLHKQEATVVFDDLNGHKPQHHNLLKLHLNKDHGNLRLECHQCDNGLGYNKLLGLMPSGIFEESSVNDQDTQLIIYLNDDQAISVVAFLKAAQEDCKNGQENACLYDSEKHNCVDFLQDAYRAAGIQGDFADFITEEQLGFSAGEILSADLYGHKAKGYIYARKHGMTNTIHVAVKAYEAVQVATEMLGNAYASISGAAGFISGALGFGADTEEQGI